MTWRCELIQRWLPEYLDGDLGFFRRRRVEAHLGTCPVCRQELAEFTQVLEFLKAHPVALPTEPFWAEFGRELHLKLVQANQTPARGRAQMFYYLLVGPVVVGLLLMGLGYLGQPQKPVLPQLAPAEQVVYAGLDDGLWQDEEFPSWDINAVLADLSDQEREAVLKKVGY